MKKKGTKKAKKAKKTMLKEWVVETQIVVERLVCVKAKNASVAENLVKKSLSEEFSIDTYRIDIEGVSTLHEYNWDHNEAYREARECAECGGEKSKCSCARDFHRQQRLPPTPVIFNPFM